MTRSRPAAGVTRGLAVAAALLALAAVALAAPKKPKTPDLVWTHPDFASFEVRSIAMLPVATFDNNLEAENTVGRGIGVALHTSGHRWISAATVRELVRGDADAEALIKSARAGMLASGRIDSLLAPRLCARLHADAVLASRVDLWEQRKLEWNEAGKPSTTVQVRAALVDSLGRLLWTASGSEFGEGPYHDPSESAPEMLGGGVNRQSASGQGGPPSYGEVLDKLLARWGPQFPAMPAPAPATPKTP